jgi:SM-20-related protein
MGCELDAQYVSRHASEITSGLADRGVCVVDDFVGRADVASLAAALLERRDSLRPARVGRGAGLTEAPYIRGDRIAWLDAPHGPAEANLLAQIDTLRIELNRELMLGLTEFEGHYAHYPPGARYERHRDRHATSDARVISLVLYLNTDWPADAGGELRVHLPDDGALDIVPVGGRLVALRADLFEHEVLPAKRDRYSFTGWLRRG